MNTSKTFKINIAEVWIEDGFELTEEKLKAAILSQLLPYAVFGEVEVLEVTSASP